MKQNILNKLRLFSVLICSLGSLPALAASSYRINGLQTQKIDEWSRCEIVTNNTSYDLFVPTNTSLEWALFLQNAPTSITDCPLPPPASPPPPPASNLCNGVPMPPNGTDGAVDQSIIATCYGCSDPMNACSGGIVDGTCNQCNAISSKNAANAAAQGTFGAICLDITANIASAGSWNCTDSGWQCSSPAGWACSAGNQPSN